MLMSSVDTLLGTLILETDIVVGGDESMERGPREWISLFERYANVLKTLRDPAREQRTVYIWNGSLYRLV